MKKQKSFWFLTILVLILPNLNAQTAKEDLDQTLIQTFQQHQIPGMAVAIVDKDQILYQNAFGYADIASKKPYTQQTIHNIGSTSKTFIGIAVMQLIEQGKISLDTKINDILPFSVHHPKFPKTEITVRHLVTHTASLHDHYKSYSLKAYTSTDATKGNRKGLPLIYKIQFKASQKNQNLPLGTYLQNVLSKKGKWYRKKNFTKKEPGTHYHYSNIGAALAAYIVEIVSNTPFDQYTQKHILQPLQMNASGWKEESVNLDNFASRYIDQTAIPKYKLTSYPDGGLISSCEDLSQYCKSMIGGYQQGNKVLSASSFQTLMTNQFDKTPLATTIQSKDKRIGVFWNIFGSEGIGDIGHSGSDPGILSFMYFDPVSGIGCILLTNTDSHKDHPKVVELWEVLISHRSNFVQEK